MVPVYLLDAHCVQGAMLRGGGWVMVGEGVRGVGEEIRKCPAHH